MNEKVIHNTMVQKCPFITIVIRDVSDPTRRFHVCSMFRHVWLQVMYDVTCDVSDLTREFHVCLNLGY